MIKSAIHIVMAETQNLATELYAKLGKMTDELIIPSLIIIGAVALYTYVTGFGKRTQFSDAKQAQALLQKTSASPVTQILTSTNNRTALALFKDGHKCLLHTMGHKWVTQTLSPNSIRKIKTTSKGLYLDFRNYTDPHVSISLSNDEARSAWRTALSGDQ